MASKEENKEGPGQYELNRADGIDVCKSTTHVRASLRFSTVCVEVEIMTLVKSRVEALTLRLFG